MLPGRFYIQKQYQNIEISDSPKKEPTPCTNLHTHIRVLLSMEEKAAEVGSDSGEMVITDSENEAEPQCVFIFAEFCFSTT